MPESPPTPIGAGIRLGALLQAALHGQAELVVPPKSDGPATAADPLVSAVTLDSRRVTPGTLYAALPGAITHGARFGIQAQDSGAVAILTDRGGADLLIADGLTLPIVIVDDPRARLGGVAADVYRHPAERLTLLGVTGTNGKTTTTYLLHAVLSQLGRKAGLIGTVETRIGAERIKSVRTTPESPDLQALFAQMLAAGADSCAMEISSHALALHRVDGVVVDVAGFTNLSQDHLDFHATLQEYFEAKATLFTPEHASAAVVCVDDEWGRRLARTATVPVTTLLTRFPDSYQPAISLDERDVDWRVTHTIPDHDGPGMRVQLTHRDGHVWNLTSPLPGDFNVANTCLAALMLLRIGLDPAEISTALAAAPGVPGRMEVVTAPGTGPADQRVPFAVVDYAHSPGSIAAACSALRSTGSQPLVIVIGAGGDRDRSKRESMGRAAVEGADGVVITDDNPRTEDPAAIRATVLAGARAAQQTQREHGRRPSVLEECGDRRQAIERAVHLALELAEGRGAGATRPAVLVAGKGHETGQEIARTVHPFDDRVVLADVLADLVGAAPDRQPDPLPGQQLPEGPR